MMQHDKRNDSDGSAPFLRYINSSWQVSIQGLGLRLPYKPQRKYNVSFSAYKILHAKHSIDSVNDLSDLIAMITRIPIV